MRAYKRLTSLFLCIILLTSCEETEDQSLKGFYKKDLGDVTQIEITDGSTGYQKTVSDPTFIQNFLEEIQNVQFIRAENQEEKEGFTYSITLSQEAYTFSFALNYVNDRYYYTEPDLYPIVDLYYKNLNIPEE